MNEQHQVGLPEGADSARTWSYQAPCRPASHPNQCHYRANEFNHIEIGGAAPDAPALTLFRFGNDTSCKLTFDWLTHSFNAQLDAPSILALRNALSDALQDIAAAEEERERRESFKAIQDEMRDSDEFGGSGVYYVHPDVHYVLPEQVAAKVRELEAAGVPRYMVLPHPAFAPQVAA